MKSSTIKIVFWITTIIIFVFEGIIPALTSHTEFAKEGLRHLGYPVYFGAIFVFFKVAGALVLVIPRIPDRVKEWAYAGFTYDFLFASASVWVVDGFGIGAVFPLVFLGILAVSYIMRRKMLQSAI